MCKDPDVVCKERKQTKKGRGWPIKTTLKYYRRDSNRISGIEGNHSSNCPQIVALSHPQAGSNLDYQLNKWEWDHCAIEIGPHFARKYFNKFQKMITSRFVWTAQKTCCTSEKKISRSSIAVVKYSILIGCSKSHDYFPPIRLVYFSIAMLLEFFNDIASWCTYYSNN